MESKITLLHKGGYEDKKELKYYKPIVLMITLGKIFCTVIKQRMEGLIENNGILGEEQNGFRRGMDNLYWGKLLIKQGLRMVCTSPFWILRRLMI